MFRKLPPDAQMTARIWLSVIPVVGAVALGALVAILAYVQSKQNKRIKELEARQRLQSVPNLNGVLSMFLQEHASETERWMSDAYGGLRAAMDTFVDANRRELQERILPQVASNLYNSISNDVQRDLSAEMPRMAEEIYASVSAKTAKYVDERFATWQPAPVAQPTSLTPLTTPMPSFAQPLVPTTTPHVVQTCAPAVPAALVARPPLVAPPAVVAPPVPAALVASNGAPTTAPASAQLSVYQTPKVQSTESRQGSRKTESSEPIPFILRSQTPRSDSLSARNLQMQDRPVQVLTDDSTASDSKTLSETEVAFAAWMNTRNSHPQVPTLSATDKPKTPPKTALKGPATPPSIRSNDRGLEQVRPEQLSNQQSRRQTSTQTFFTTPHHTNVPTGLVQAFAKASTTDPMNATGELEWPALAPLLGPTHMDLSYASASQSTPQVDATDSSGVTQTENVDTTPSAQQQRNTSAAIEVSPDLLGLPNGTTMVQTQVANVRTPKDVQSELVTMDD